MKFVKATTVLNDVILINVDHIVSLEYVANPDYEPHAGVRIYFSGGINYSIIVKGTLADWEDLLGF